MIATDDQNIQKTKTLYFPEEKQMYFYRALKDFMYHFGCVYLSFVCEDEQQSARLGYTSNPDWQNEYIGNRLIEGCHLWKAVNTHFIQSGQSNLILPWSLVKPKLSSEKDILLYREEFDIGQGVSFCQRQNGLREFFAINPAKNNPNFITLVSKNIELIRSHVTQFKTAASSLLQQTITQGQNHV